MSKIWRIAPETYLVNYANKRGEYRIPAEMIDRLRPGNYLVMASWDPIRKEGNASLAGLVETISPNAKTAMVSWKKIKHVFNPTTQGANYWNNAKGWFEFAPNVIKRYRLRETLKEQFSSTEIPQPPERVSSRVNGGYVYLIRSEHGYKIGKTTSVKSRVKLFGVKLPFDIELEHYAYFDDHHSAERELHERFSNKRIQGEWFDLNPIDVELIKSFGLPIDTKGF